jgi:hypothetical protein
MPKFYTFFLLALGFLLLSSISIAPNMGRKPKLAADGARVTRADGSTQMQPDVDGHIKTNWFGYGAAILSILFFVLGILRLVWTAGLVAWRLP